VITWLQWRAKEGYERRRKTQSDTRNNKRKIKNADMCREFGLVNSTFQEICKNRTKIISVSEQNGEKVKR